MTGKGEFMNGVEMWALLCKIADVYADARMSAVERDDEIRDLLINASVMESCDYCDYYHRDPELCPQYPTEAQRLAETLVNGNVTLVGQRLRNGSHELLIDTMAAYAEITHYAMAEVARRFKVAWNAASD